MSLKKCGDQDGIYFEMIKYGSARLIWCIWNWSLHWSRVVLQMTVGAIRYPRWFPKLVAWRREPITDPSRFCQRFTKSLLVWFILDCYHCLIAIKAIINVHSAQACVLMMHSSWQRQSFPNLISMEETRNPSHNQQEKLPLILRKTCKISDQGRQTCDSHQTYVNMLTKKKHLPPGPPPLECPA